MDQGSFAEEQETGSVVPRRETIIRVLVASPGDVPQEREAVDEVIDEINRSWSSRLSVRLATVKWETDSRPGIATNGQEVINDQLGLDYDIFLGIMWSRAGTPTRRAESGTIEEFRRAYERYKASPGSVRVMMYFKDAPIPPSRIDPTQLARVQSFATELQQAGVLYRRFSALEEFTRCLRMHLASEAQSFAGTSQTGTAVPASVQDNGKSARTSGVEDGLDQEAGFLDLVELATEGMAAATRVADQLTSLTSNLGERIASCARELQGIGPPNDMSGVKRAKHAVNEAATEMAHFAEQVESLLPTFRASQRQAMDSYGKAATLLSDFQSDDATHLEQLQLALGAVKLHNQALADARDKTSTFRGAIHALPRVTTKLNRAKRKCLDALAGLDTEFQSAVNLSAETERLIRDVRGQGNETTR